MLFSFKICLLLRLIFMSTVYSMDSDQSTCNVTFSPEARIGAYILQGYTKEVRPPSTRADGKIKISFAMNLMQIMAVNVKAEELTTTLYMQYQWTDIRLAWNASDHNSITELRIPVDAIWVPNIILQNSVDEKMGPGALKVNAIVSNSGSVSWLPPAIYTTSCSIDISLFPFDWQNCSLNFRSAALDQSQMIFDIIEGIGNKITVDSAFVENGEWQLLQRPIKIYSPPREDQFQKIYFFLLVRRKPQFYILNILLPTFILSLLSCIAFCLPALAGEKITLSISLLLGDTIFAFLFVQRMPSTSVSVSFTAAYLLFSMTMMLISIVCSVLAYNFHYRSQRTHKLPIRLKTFFIDILGPFLQMKQPNKKWTHSTSKPTTNSATPENTNILWSRGAIGKPPSQILFENQRSRFGFKSRQTEFPYSNENGISNQFPSPIQSSPQRFLPALECSKYVAKHIRSEQKNEMIIDDWNYLAMIVDRLCLWIYTFTFLLVSLIYCIDISSYEYPSIDMSLPKRLLP